MSLKQDLRYKVGARGTGLFRHFAEYIKQDGSSVLSPISESSRCFLFGTAVNGNVGDEAIAYAQIQFLKRYFDDIVDTPTGDFWSNVRKVKSIIKAEDIIFFQGGGNMGEMYEWQELERCTVIESFKNNPIIIFPQTISYKDESSKLLKYTEKVYNAHGSNLYLFAREKKSFDLMKKFYRDASVNIVPDIVLSLGTDSLFQREGTIEMGNSILFCFRNDPEKSLNDADKRIIEKYAKDSDIPIDIQDSFIGDIRIEPSQRASEISKLIKRFRSAKVVVTDRLHGMVLAAMAGVPCLVFGNFNHKVEGVYKWIEDLDYLEFVKRSDEILPSLQRLLTKDHVEFPQSIVNGKYQSLQDTIRALQ